MSKALLLATALALPFTSVLAQSNAAPPSDVALANLSEQVRALTAQVGDLALQLDQLKTENAALRAKLASASSASATTATVAQLNAAVADLRSLVQSTDQASREQIAAQIKKLGDQTNAALAAIAKGQAARPDVQTPFTDDYPKDGIIRYTVQKGDSLGLVVKKTGAKQQDIINANKLAPPYTIQVGQTLLIPGGKLPPPTS